MQSGNRDSKYGVSQCTNLLIGREVLEDADGLELGLGLGLGLGSASEKELHLTTSHYTSLIMPSLSCHHVET